MKKVIFSVFIIRESLIQLLTTSIIMSLDTNDKVSEDSEETILEFLRRLDAAPVESQEQAIAIRRIQRHRQIIEYCKDKLLVEGSIEKTQYLLDKVMRSQNCTIQNLIRFSRNLTINEVKMNEQERSLKAREEKLNAQFRLLQLQQQSRKSPTDQQSSCLKKIN